jgi:serine/threonine protein kinase
MPPVRKCPRCNATVHPDTAEGLCPACLLQQAAGATAVPTRAPGREGPMIAFACMHCGMKLKVKPEFAGRSSRCPTCKQPLAVPHPSKTQADIAAGQLDGSDSSLAKAGVEGGVTLQPAGRSGRKSVQDLLNRQGKKGQRYTIEGEMARGGMGAVLRAVDCDLRREVAIKYLLDQTNPDKKLRFIEEAQITGQLEHPNIVPIHELGVDAKKRLFFSMKMVKGRSLAQVLDEVRQDPKAAEKDYSLARLLNVFVSICNGLAYAHSRGVVHRDLKPANIMIGDFGEVYVMDWGLAKVLASGGTEPAGDGSLMATAASAGSVPPLPSAITSSHPSSKVDTSREPEADLTQEGSVLGTPVYMPPEQATGQVHAIDQRSDVYALGAILYEILTLQPPIDRAGGHMAILIRVVEGAIVPPEQRRSRGRKAGIPRELSAIAMKALATLREDRYPTVEELRRDVERFQDGRSVSAKEDTARELMWKFVKRNKGFSFGMTLAFLVLVVSLGYVTNAWLATTKAQAALRKQTDDAVPALVRSARLALNERQFEDCLHQADLALAYAPDNADALLIKAQVFIVRQDFARAATDLQQVLRYRPADHEARELLDLCSKGKPDDIATLLAFARIFHQQQAYSLVDGLLGKYGKNSQEARRFLLHMYQGVIERAWKGKGDKLKIDPFGLHLLLEGSFPQLSDLSPLKGMPLTSADFAGCATLGDLTPLKGMPLRKLSLIRCQVRDLTPLQGMKLTTLDLTDCHQVESIAPLKDMPLTSLQLYRCFPLSDLTPLRGMPLETLDIFFLSQVRDLTPLNGMPLRWLRMDKCENVHDVTPLQGMKLEELVFTPKSITKGMDVLRQMKSLKTIGLEPQMRFPADEFWKRYDAGEFR